MPFKSERQRRFLWAKKPHLARKFAEEEKRKAMKKKLAEMSKKRKKS